MQNSIRTALTDSLVWPSRIVVPMIPGGDFRYIFPKELNDVLLYFAVVDTISNSVDHVIDES